MLTALLADRTAWRVVEGEAARRTTRPVVETGRSIVGGRIAAAERSRDDLDSLIGPGTAVIDDPELVLYPAFADTHNHQLMAARDLDYVIDYAGGRLLFKSPIPSVAWRMPIAAPSRT